MWERLAGPVTRRAVSLKEQLHWGRLRWLGNSRVVKSSYLWFFVVPIAAKLIGPFAGTHALWVPWWNQGEGRIFHVDVSLPFSWKAFYVMSIAFMAAQGVYAIWCPPIVKQYANFGDYRAEHAGPAQLLRVLWRIVVRRDPAEVRAVLRGCLRSIDKSLDDEAKGCADQSGKVPPDKRDKYFLMVRDKLTVGSVHESVLSAAFDCALEVERKAHPRARAISAVFFGLGLLLFCAVALQNIAFTVRLLW